MSKAVNIVVGGLWAFALISACHTAKNAATVDQDVAAAQEKAAEKTQKAQESADAKIDSARTDLQSQERDAAHTSAVQTQKVADTEADGAHKVALAACEGLSGDPQKSCRDKADADYQAAQARAAQTRAVSDPKP
jgi:hypothetical protein